MHYKHTGSIVLAAYDHVRTKEKFMHTAKIMGTPDDIATSAMKNLAEGTVVALVVSGPQASGKDTIGPAVMSFLGAQEHVRAGVADGIKLEATTILEKLAYMPDKASAIIEVAEMLDLKSQHAEFIVDALWDITRDPLHGLTGWSRTPETRRALQYLGSEAREEDPERYVRMVVPRILGLLASGTSVYMGDGRFPKEAGHCREIGMFLVRLHVEHDIKAARLLTRDGVIADPKALQHEGETALDNWPGVDLKVDNSHAETSVVVATVGGALALHRARLQTWFS
jgi:hypothetical protein